MAYRFQNIPLFLNGKSMIVNSASLNQDANLFPSFRVGDFTTTNLVPESETAASLSLQYFLTGKDILRDYFSSLNNEAISGDVGGLKFKKGYVNSYTATLSQNQPIAINANIVIFDAISGELTKQSPVNISNKNFLNSSNAYITINHFNIPSLVINNVRWAYRANIEPSYEVSNSGFSNDSLRHIVIGEKNIQTDITCESSLLSLPFSGEMAAIDIFCPAGDASERFSCSGLVNKKSFDIDTDSSSKINYSITQYHINDIPQIYSVDTSSYSANRQITITSTNKINGFLTENEKLPIVNQVMVGDSTCDFDIFDDTNNHYITATLPVDAIDGILALQTTRGTVAYSSGLTLNHPAIVISGFTPDYGSIGSTVLISGINFYRVSRVLFNSGDSNFQVINTGNTHFIRAVVPPNAEVGKINIQSQLRKQNVLSSNIFYPQMSITSLNPAMAKWGETVTISGINFSGVTGVYFNGIKSPSITIPNNKSIQAQTPATGSGYAGGYVSVFGYKGMKNYSPYEYLPLMPISGLSTDPVELTIIFNTLDTGYLCRQDNGFKVKVDSQNIIFAKYNNYSLTGLTAGDTRTPRVSIYRPDGITTYPTFTGVYTKIGPSPAIYSLRFDGANYGPTSAFYHRLAKYRVVNAEIKGKNFKDFEGYGLPWKAVFRHHDFPNEYNHVLSFTSYLTDSSVFIDFAITGRTGFYDLLLQNGASADEGITGLFTGAVRCFPPIPLSTAVSAKASDMSKGEGIIDLPYINNLSYSVDHVNRSYPNRSTVKYDNGTFGPYPLNNNFANGLDPNYPNGYVLSYHQMTGNERGQFNLGCAASLNNALVDSGCYIVMDLRNDWSYIGGKNVQVREIHAATRKTNNNNTILINASPVFNDYVPVSYSGWVTAYDINNQPILNVYNPDFRTGFYWSGGPLLNVDKIVIYAKYGGRSRDIGIGKMYAMSLGFFEAY